MSTPQPSDVARTAQPSDVVLATREQQLAEQEAASAQSGQALLQLGRHRWRCWCSMHVCERYQSEQARLQAAAKQQAQP